ncbi:ABC-three component system middle component 6 [Levilactobacillus koreensis]|uniref:Uncharacterized protein n=1 Tax=Levilactobacillus koreensis TaxID=637971 RepID=A0AAC8UV68_9LACO|nr:hypothetical protein ABN16_05450 [Levilactobacillus koreensis]
MLLVDRNKEPINTVFYLSALIQGVLQDNKGMDYASLLTLLSKDILKKNVNIEVYSLALDFLFLLGKITISERGKIVCL